MDLKNDLTHINLAKNSLGFLADRILELKYRGKHLVQHARHKVDDFISILEGINKYSTDGMLRIRTTDSKSRFDKDEEKDYALFIDDLQKKLSKGTKDGIRKVVFPDMHRMGFITRYGKDKKETDPYKKQHVFYVQVTDLGNELIKLKKNAFKKNALFTQRIDVLTKGIAQQLFDICVEENLKSISVYEYMFFLSFIDKKIGHVTYNKDDIVALLKDYQTLTSIEKKQVIDAVKKYCDPSNFRGDKTKKRDFGNWKNEAESLFCILENSMYFSVDHQRNNQSLKIRIGKDGIYGTKEKLKRSQQEKDEYYKQHGVKKTHGFELHHIVPLLLANNASEFAILDRWQNMIYIDGKNHDIISQTGNKNIILSFNNDDVILSDFSAVKKLPDINAKFNIDVLYSTKFQTMMKDTNQEIITSL